MKAIGPDLVEVRACFVLGSVTEPTRQFIARVKVKETQVKWIFGWFSPIAS